MPRLLLDDQRVLVTGGSRGIGAAVVRTALREGAEVAFTYHSNVDAAQALVDVATKQFPDQRCLAQQCNVADVDRMAEVIEAVRSELGPIDVLVNNAGITRDVAFARMKWEQWDDVLTTNLGGVYAATRPLALQFVKQGSGSIINLSSITGVYGQAAQVNYAASKAGIIGFTKALALELAPFKVRVNAVAPGLIDTDMLSNMTPDLRQGIIAEIPAGRLGTADEVAEVVCFLASDRASYITGQVVEVSGGLTV